MSYARQLATRVAPLAGWSYTPEERAGILRATRNGAGLSVRFIDGSRAFIPAGTATVEVRGDHARQVETYRKVQFRLIPGLSDYLACGLQDLQYNENDRACEDEREPEDTGTIYDMPSETFASLRRDYVKFLEDAGADGREFREEHGAELFGSDFHLSRSGHGAGFFDRSPVGRWDGLQELARKAGNRDWDIGGNGKVYVS
jgi:hypothetical protein